MSSPRQLHFVFAALLLALFGCSTPAVDEQDAGESSDAGEAPDAGDISDGGELPDGGVPEIDAGPPPFLRCRALDGGPLDAESDGGFRLRVMAANLTSGNLQSYDPGHGVRVFQGLTPDVVLLNEFNYGSNTEVELRAFVDQAFGPDFCFSREQGASIPNGVISRYPIIEEGEWDDPAVIDRDFAWARIDLPGPKDLLAVSVHLLTASASVRSGEASTLVSYLNQEVTDGDLLLVGGDFNTGSRTEGALSTLSQFVVTSAPHPVDQGGNGGTNAARTKPYDWVLASSSLKAFQVPVEVGGDSFAAGLVFDSRDFTPISSVPPVLATDSAAPNMQHMAVVKEFFLP